MFDSVSLCDIVFGLKDFMSWLRIELSNGKEQNDFETKQTFFRKF